MFPGDADMAAAVAELAEPLPDALKPLAAVAFVEWFGTALSRPRRRGRLTCLNHRHAASAPTRQLRVEQVTQAVAHQVQP